MWPSVVKRVFSSDSHKWLAMLVCEKKKYLRDTFGDTKPSFI